MNYTNTLRVQCVRATSLVIAGLAIIAAPTYAANAIVEGISTEGADANHVKIWYRCEGENCDFEAVLDQQLKDEAIEYHWEFSDGSESVTTVPFVEHTWDMIGDKNTKLSVYNQHCDLFFAEAMYSLLALPGEADNTSDDVTSVPDVDNEPTPDVQDPTGNNTLSSSLVQIGQSSQRIPSEPLEGVVVRGDVYIFIEELTDARQVRFALIGPESTTVFQQAESKPPYDLAGGSALEARSFNTRSLTDGRYRLDVTAEYTDGGVENISIELDVLNSSTENSSPQQPEPDVVAADDTDSGSDNTIEPPAAANPEEPVDEPVVVEQPVEEPVAVEEPVVVDQPVVQPTVSSDLVFSDRHDRSNSRSLAGASLHGRVYVSLSGAEKADSVKFFIDDIAMTGPPLQVERHAPWDMFGGSERRARPFKTQNLSNGQHVLSAQIEEGGQSYVVHAGFTVAN